MATSVDPKVLARAIKIAVVIAGFIAVAAFQEFGSQWKARYEPQTEASSQTSDEHIYRKVIRVVDGDTIHVDVDGTDETVRLIGINTPETVDPRRTVECFGKEASNRMKELVSGNIVYLETDPSQSERDSYGRLLAYVYLEDGQMVNRKMIAEGYAYEYTYLTPYKYQKEFRQLQNFAKASGYGLWSQSTCAGKKAM